MNAYLPPFTADEGLCSKCSAAGALVEWQPNGTDIGPYGLISSPQLGDNDEPGWLLRTCRACGYRWPEATLDSGSR